jgi:hypothetical protein
VISKVTVIELAIPSLVLRAASNDEWCLSWLKDADVRGAGEDSGERQEACSGEESFPSRGEFFVRRDQEMTVPGATAASEKGICSTRVLSVRELLG